MIILQNIYQVVVRPTFLILFLFGFLGAQCSRVTGGGTPPDTEKAVAEQKAKADAAAKDAEEARKRAEAAKQAGDAAKATEEEKKAKAAEAEAEKQRQIQTALETAASAVNRAHEAVERVAAAKEPFNGTGFASGKPFSILEREVKKARAEAFKAYDAVHAATEASVAVAKAEEASLAADRAEQQTQIAAGFLNRFQSQFTFNADEKALLSSRQQARPALEGLTSQQYSSKCKESLQGLTQAMPTGVGVSMPPVSVECLSEQITGPLGTTLTYYNCFCEYNWSNRPFYKRQ